MRTLEEIRYHLNHRSHICYCDTEVAEILLRALEVACESLTAEEIEHTPVLKHGYRKAHTTEDNMEWAIRQAQDADDEEGGTRC